MIFPLLVTFLILVCGWRAAWFWYGVLTITVLVPVGLLVRSSPEIVGLLPDGSEEQSDTPDRVERHAENVNLTRGEAVRTPTFWLLSLIHI